MTYKNHLFSYDKFILYLTSNEFRFSLQELFSSNNNFEEQLKRGGNYYFFWIYNWEHKIFNLQISEITVYKKTINAMFNKTSEVHKVWTSNYYYNLIVDWKYILKRKGLKEWITKDKLKKEIKKLLTNYKFKSWYVNYNIKLTEGDSIRFWKVYEYLKQISK